MRQPRGASLFTALRRMLRAAPEIDIREQGSALLPNELPVFRRQYLKDMQIKVIGQLRNLAPSSL